MATTALTLHPPENFNLAINGQIRQIAKLKLPPNFNYRQISRKLWKYKLNTDFSTVRKLWKVKLNTDFSTVRKLWKVKLNTDFSTRPLPELTISTVLTLGLTDTQRDGRLCGPQ